MTAASPWGKPLSPAMHNGVNSAFLALSIALAKPEK
jgi:hypothetical protein